MKEFNNRTLRHLDSEEMTAIMQAAGLLEKAFGEKVFAVNVNPRDGEPDRVWGVSFAFDVMLVNKKGGGFK
jgi:hypothetical protein